MLPKSIRRQLPLTYAAIALLAAVSLGVVLLVVLRGYYSQREYDHLRGNAMAISQTLASSSQVPSQISDIRLQLPSISFLTQSRIQLLNDQHVLIADSGSFTDKQIITFQYQSAHADIALDSQENHIFGFSQAEPVPLPAEVMLSVPAETWETRLEANPSSAFMITTGTTDVAAASAPRDRDFMMRVAGTPYGFGLNVDETSGQRSDQQVEMPLVNSDKHLMGYIVLSEGPAYGMEIVKGVARALVAAGIVAVLVAAGVGWFVSHRITGPLDVLTQTTGKMAGGDLTARVNLQQADEFGLLAKSFNEMAHQVEHTVTTLKRFVSDAAHELQTPLTAAYANLELALSEPDAQHRLSFLEQSRTQLKRLEMLTNNLLDLSRLEAGQELVERTPVDLKEMMQMTSELYASRAEQKGIEFDFKFPLEPIHIRANESQLHRVLGNLLDNAIKFTPENGRIEVGFDQRGNQVRLWVKDTGIGIPNEDLIYLFNRFKRGRNASAYPGSGLGLAITKAIVEGHQGTVDVESSERGTHFWVNLPVVV